MVSKDEILSYLAQVSSLKSLAANQFEELAGMCQVVSFDSGVHIFCHCGRSVAVSRLKDEIAATLTRSRNEL